MSSPPQTQTDSWHPRHFLRPCLLLLLSESSAHGYDLLDRLGELGLERDAGGLYRTLRTMEHEGLVASEWEASTLGPDRRRYSLTSLGRQRLETWAAGLDLLRGSLEGFLKRYRAVLSPVEAN